MAEASTERVRIKNVKPFDVSNVRQYKDTIFFTLSGGGLYISGCRIVKGSKGDFISWPQQKGKDGKYYTIARLYLSDEAESNLIARVGNELGSGNALADWDR